MCIFIWSANQSAKRNARERNNQKKILLSVADNREVNFLIFAVKFDQGKKKEIIFIFQMFLLLDDHLDG